MIWSVLIPVPTGRHSGVRPGAIICLVYLNGGMRILVTGHRGNVGGPVARHLEHLGHEVVGFDRADGMDLLDLSQVRHAASGCAAVVHLAALAHDTAGSPEQIMAVNVLGTWHVLLAAEGAGVERIVHFSSAQVLGIAEGERQPDYFPVDDAHPRRAMRAYGLSKRLAEDLCAAFTARTGIASLSLRPVWVWNAGEYGAFVDVRDVATAVELALAVPLSGHHRALLCAADITATKPSLDIAAQITPQVPVRNSDLYLDDPRNALIDCSAAQTLLGWRPRYRWPTVAGQRTPWPPGLPASSAAEHQSTSMAASRSISCMVSASVSASRGGTSHRSPTPVAATAALYAAVAPAGNTACTARSLASCRNASSSLPARTAS
jgi:UDP-glucose 4-epimerase